MSTRAPTRSGQHEANCERSQQRQALETVRIDLNQAAPTRERSTPQHDCTQQHTRRKLQRHSTYHGVGVVERDLHGSEQRRDRRQRDQRQRLRSAGQESAKNGQRRVSAELGAKAVIGTGVGACDRAAQPAPSQAPKRARAANENTRLGMPQSDTITITQAKTIGHLHAVVVLEFVRPDEHVQEQHHDVRPATHATQRMRKGRAASKSGDGKWQSGKPNEPMMQGRR